MSRVVKTLWYSRKHVLVPFIPSQLLFLMDRTSPLAIVITTALPLLPVVLLQSLHDAVVPFGGV